jgi:hypothetical protein
MRNTCLWLAASLVLALTFGCKSKDTTDSKQPAEAKHEPAGSVSAGEMGTFTCKDIQNDACVGPTDHFDAAVPVVYVTYKTTDLPKTGDAYAIQWIAEDVGSAAPANTVIATLNEPVKDIAAGATSYTVNTHLTRPNKGWPVGKYRVEVKLGDKLVTTAHFTIQ